MAELFRKFAERTAHVVGSPWTFLVALAVVLTWGVSGPLFSYSDTWQLLINTSTTIITFLMVFIIQNTQNRDSHVVNLKLDELLRAQKGARKEIIGLDHMSDEELNHVQEQFEKLQGKYGVLVDDDIAHVRDEIHSRRKSAKPSPNQDA